MNVYDYDVYNTSQLNAIKFGGMAGTPTLYNLTSRFFVILHGYSTPLNHEAVAATTSEFLAHILQRGIPFLFISRKLPECIDWFYTNHLPVISIGGGSSAPKSDTLVSDDEGRVAHQYRDATDPADRAFANNNKP
jgi:hypothetical protein